MICCHAKRIPSMSLIRCRTTLRPIHSIIDTAIPKKTQCSQCPWIYYYADYLSASSDIVSRHNGPQYNIEITKNSQIRR